mmetsp:Transcript_22060/g.34692  ORF Transcript_22060/g.34692 Transcript_22060/m.34692 type:complete len:203 (-) Transcript_22060:221-829(-)
MRYRKLASQYGDKYDTTSAENKKNTDSTNSSARSISRKGRVRFAEMELKDENAEILSSILSKSKQPLSLPYIILHYNEGSGGSGASSTVMRRDDFQCSPKKFGMLVDAVEELMTSSDSDSEKMTVGKNGPTGGGGEGEEDLNHRSSLPLNGGDLAFSSQRSMDGSSTSTSTTTTVLTNGLGATQFYLSTLNIVSTQHHRRDQ